MADGWQDMLSIMFPLIPLPAAWPRQSSCQRALVALFLEPFHPWCPNRANQQRPFWDLKLFFVSTVFVGGVFWGKLWVIATWNSLPAASPHLDPMSAPPPSRYWPVELVGPQTFQQPGIKSRGWSGVTGNMNWNFPGTFWSLHRCPAYSCLFMQCKVTIAWLFARFHAMEGSMGSIHPSFGFLLDNDVTRLVLHPILTSIFCKSLPYMLGINLPTWTIRPILKGSSAFTYRLGCVEMPWVIHFFLVEADDLPPFAHQDAGFVFDVRLRQRSLAMPWLSKMDRISSDWYAFKMQRIQKANETKDPEKTCGRKVVQFYHNFLEPRRFCKNWFSSFLDSISTFMAYLSCRLMALSPQAGPSWTRPEIPLPTTCCGYGSHKGVGLTNALWINRINLWANSLVFDVRKLVDWKIEGKFEIFKSQDCSSDEDRFTCLYVHTTVTPWILHSTHSAQLLPDQPSPWQKTADFFGLLMR